MKLNDNELTKNDERNAEAKLHLNHNLMKIGQKLTNSHKLPYRFTDIQQYLCKDCKKMFQTFNWYDLEHKSDTEVE